MTSRSTGLQVVAAPTTPGRAVTPERENGAANPIATTPRCSPRRPDSPEWNISKQPTGSSSKRVGGKVHSSQVGKASRPGSTSPPNTSSQHPHQDAVAPLAMCPDMSRGMERGWNEEDSTMKEFLSCSICWEPYDEKSRQPKMLSCHHTFCKACLRQLTRHHRLITCSTCRKDTVVLDGPGALQTNFYVTYVRQKFGDKSAAEQEGGGSSVCTKHSCQPLSFFCRTCTEVVCRDCIVLMHSQQDGHDLQDLTEVKAEYIFSLSRIRREVDAALNVHSDYTERMLTELEALDAAQEATTQHTDRCFDQLVDTVNQRRSQVKEQIKETHEDLHRQVNESIVEVERRTGDLQGIREELEKVTARGNLPALMNLANSEKLKEQISDLTFRPADADWNNYFTFSANGAEKALEACLSTVGSLQYDKRLPAYIDIDTTPPHFPALSYSPATRPTASLPACLTVCVRDYLGTPLAGYQISIDICDPFDDHLQVKRRREGEDDDIYIFTYIPQVAGLHQCFVTFLGVPLGQKPTTVKVSSNNPVRTIGVMGKAPKQLMYPCSLKIHPDTGALYVVDEGNQRIQVFTNDGDGPSETISVAGDDRQARAFDVALDTPRGQLVCTRVLVEQRKAWADTVQLYSLTDHRLTQSFSNERMKKALYVAVNGQGEIIVPDYHLGQMFMYSGGGDLLREVGKIGTGPGEFREPAFVCIGPDDDILISDCRNGRIQVLNKYGEYKYEIGKGPSGAKGTLQGPSGVAVDRKGNVLVTDRLTKRILVYKYNGEFVSCIDSKGDKMSDPRGLAVTNDGHVYVADQKNHCIKKYRYL